MAKNKVEIPITTPTDKAEKQMKQFQSQFKQFSQKLGDIQRRAGAGGGGAQGGGFGQQAFGGAVAGAAFSAGRSILRGAGGMLRGFSKRASGFADPRLTGLQAEQQFGEGLKEAVEDIPLFGDALGFGLEQAAPAVRAQIEEVQNKAAKQVQQLAAKLGRAGVELSEENVKNLLDEFTKSSQRSFEAVKQANKLITENQKSLQQIATQTVARRGGINLFAGL